MPVDSRCDGARRRGCGSREGSPGSFPARGIHRRLCGILPTIALAAAFPFLGGCAAGVAGLVVGLVAISGGDSDDGPPVVGAIEVGDRECRDRIPIEFTISNEDSGRLRARMEYVLLGENLEPVTLAAEVTLVPEAGGPDPRNLPAQEPVSFVWDAETDLRGSSGLVRFIITPFEDGEKGKSSSSKPFLAGNSPVEIRKVEINPDQAFLEVSFELVDEEEDRVPVDDAHLLVEISPLGGEFHPLPLSLLGQHEFLSSRSGGLESSFGFVVTSLLDRDDVHEELKNLGRSGFIGNITVKVSVRDCVDEAFSESEADFLFQNNEKPTVEILPFQPADLRSGVIPIRYRIFDPDFLKSPIDLRVQVNFLDGEGFRSAREFPVPPSEGVTALCAGAASEDCILDPETFLGVGTPEKPYHTFLWDALSQPFSGDRVLFAIRAEDREKPKESDRGTSQVQGGFRLVPFAERKDIVAGDGTSVLIIEDFNGDKRSDLVVKDQFQFPGQVLYLEGGIDGISQVRALSIEVGSFPFDMAAGDFDGDGALDLMVANLDSATLTYLRGTEFGLFGDLREDIELPGAPLKLAAADFDGDGALDLVVGYEIRTSVSYLRGGGNLPFPLEARDIEVASSPVKALAVGDFEGNGALGLVCAFEGDNRLSYLAGKREAGDGLSPERRRDIELGVFPTSLEIGDFDGDGALDLAAASEDFDSLSFLRGGEEGFSDSRRTDIDLPGTAKGLASGDFDGDGFLDLVAAIAGAGILAYLPGSAEGISGENRLDLEVGKSPTALSAGDFDGDGFPDVAVASADSNTLGYLRGGWLGLSNAKRLDVAIGDLPVAVAAGDFEGDGSLDLVVVNQFPPLINYFRGEPGGLSEERRKDLGVGEFPCDLVLGDFDGDGALDLAVANLNSDSVSLFRGGADGFSDRSVLRVEELAVGSVPNSLAAADFDGDRILDLAVANKFSNTVSYLGGTREGFGAMVNREIPVGNQPVELLVGDFDGDGIPDLVAANEESGTVSYLRGGTGRFPGEIEGGIVEIPTGESPGALAAGDLDRDGSLDLVVANRLSGTVSLLAGGPEGLSESRRMEVEVGQNPLALALSDFDGDGSLDLAAANSGSSSVSYFRGPVSPLAGDRLDIEVGGFPLALATGDFDQDGFLDLVVGNRGLAVFFLPSTVCYLRGGVDGLTPERKTDIGVGISPNALDVRDFDGDGFLDVVVANKFSDSVSYLRGGPDGISPDRHREIRVGFSPLALSSGDINGDGYPDVVAANEGSNSASYILSRFLGAHVNAAVDPDGCPPPGGCVLADPRQPARYSLEVFSEAVPLPAQIAIVPAAVFDISQSEAASRGKFLTIISDPVRILPERLEFQEGIMTWLTLRLKDMDGDLVEFVKDQPDRLRILRWDGSRAAGEVLAASPEVVDLGSGPSRFPGVRFPILASGSYLVVLEGDR